MWPCQIPVLFFSTYWRKFAMKKSLIASFTVILALSATSALAQQKMMDGMKDMPMDNMKGMPMDNMKDMPMDNMKGMPMGKAAPGQTVHAAKGRVTKVDAGTGVVTLAHDPVKSLNWPAMTMGFSVKDKTLLGKLGVGKTVDFEFAQGDKGYVITAVK
jgi:Cu(I)/Ag(I) efflux system protein CusF